MNDIEKVDTSISIAAVMFMKMDKDRNLEIGGDKPYFYLNTIDAREQDLALVGSTGWGVVKVLRLVSVENIVALSKVTQPLLSVVRYDQSKIIEASRRLLEFRLRTSEARLQKAVDVELMDELDMMVSHTKTERRKYASGQTARSIQDDWDGDDLRNGKD